MDFKALETLYYVLETYGFLGILLVTTVVVSIPVILLLYITRILEPARCSNMVGCISQCEREVGHLPPCGIGYNAMYKEMLCSWNIRE